MKLGTFCQNAECQFFGLLRILPSDESCIHCRMKMGEVRAEKARIIFIYIGEDS